MNNLLKLYTRECDISGTPVLVMGLISGIAQSVLLGIITIAADTASSKVLNFRFFVMFLIAFSIMFIGKRYALKQGTVISQNIIKNIRVRLMDKIRNSELLFLENLGKGELYTRVVNDTTVIAQTAIDIINAAQSVIMVSFCLFFIAFLSKLAFVIAVAAVGIGIANYLRIQRAVAGELREALNKESQFFEMVDHIIDGFKELKMNSPKNNAYFSFLQTLADETKTLRTRTGFRFVTNFMYSETFFYTLLGTIVFIMPQVEQIDSELIIRITAAILFIVGPLNMVVTSVPAFAMASVAIEHLYTLEGQLDAAHQAYGTDQQPSIIPLSSFDTLTLENAIFSYTDQFNASLFTVGPINLSVRQGEILFIVGGNGCGKTTFLKLLTGLYYPSAGTITVDNLRLERPMYQSYREIFSVIFGDFHLFGKLFGLEHVDETKIRDLLTLMALEQKTNVIDGEFTNINLSTGQRKRLAMIVALLDDKPIYVFDEWAADQDPNFRKYYYEELLYELQKQGKTIIAVSHDDRYFHVADRVIKMEYGQIVDEQTYEHS